MVALARERDLLLHAHSGRRCGRAFVHGVAAGAHPVGALRLRSAGLRCATCCANTRNCGATSPTVPTRRRTTSVDAAWREAFIEFPDRFMVGTDTFTPERWHYIVPHADFSRGWLADLPPPVAERIAWRNAEARAARRLAEEGVSRAVAALRWPSRPHYRRARAARRLCGGAEEHHRALDRCRPMARALPSSHGPHRCRWASTSTSISSSALRRRAHRRGDSESMPTCRRTATA